MEESVRTRNYQDPLETAFEKAVAWSFVLGATDDNAPVHIQASDWSDRQFALPIGVILEIAESVRFQRSLDN